MNIFNRIKFPNIEKITRIEERGKEIVNGIRVETKVDDDSIIKLAISSVSGKFSDYNYSVVKNEDSTIDVYLLLRSKNPNFFLLGGDFKITISSDGLNILNKVQFHESVLKVPLQTEKTGGAFHTHVLNDLPTETDVAFVLLNPKLAPHYVIGKKWASCIDKSGKITIVGERQKVLK